MKKKNVFLKNKTFLIFGFFAILIFIVAILAPVFSGGIDPQSYHRVTGIFSVRIRWDVTFLPV